MIAINLKSFYLQIPLHEDCRSLIAVSIRNCRLVMLRLPFGLSESGVYSWFCVTEALSGLLEVDGVFEYLDDLLIVGNSEGELFRRANAVFERLKRC